MRTMKKQFYDTHEPDDPEDDVYSGPSKSQKKRDAEHLQSLGKELSELAPEQLATIALPEALSETIADLKKMKSFGAKRRQLQLIGKLMRALDAASVREAIDRATGASKGRSSQSRKAARCDDCGRRATYRIRDKPSRGFRSKVASTRAGSTSRSRRRQTAQECSRTVQNPLRRPDSTFESCCR